MRNFILWNQLDISLIGEINILVNTMFIKAANFDLTELLCVCSCVQILCCQQAVRLFTNFRLCVNPYAFGCATTSMIKLSWSELVFLAYYSVHSTTKNKYMVPGTLVRIKNNVKQLTLG